MINVEERDALMLVRLERAGKRNALTGAMLERLREIFSGVARCDDLRAVVLTGAGGEAFCVGTDRGELASLNEAEAREVARRGQEVCDLVESCGVPVIAAVNGLATGGGCELALACHLRVAVAHARFTLPEPRPGVLPADSVTPRLERVATTGRAPAAMIAGDGLSANEALRLGLVNRVVPALNELLPAAEFLAAEIGRHAPLAVRACLAAVTGGSRLPLAEGLALEADLFSQLFATEDMREGARAFLEKRVPTFKGQ